MSVAAYNLLGICYIAIPFAHFIALRLFPDTIGMKFFALAMLGTWACDTVAYFGGTRWGRHKLCPSVSPAKSVEGAILGFAGCLAVTLISGHYLHLAWQHGLVSGIVIGITCQLGDLVESAIKRHMGVKDSGRFFPGHGGVLDRVDSLLFSVPAVYYYLIFFVNR
jgi:phosphatidate cytidylyltransferase